jgi:predicted DNA-binding protein with PD1-like motif
MESTSLVIEKIHILRVDPGEDVLLSVKKFLAEAGLRQAVVLGGYGTLAAHHLHWVVHNRIPVDNSFGRGEGGIEILSMNGLVVEGEPHIHVTLATQAGAYGGHLEEGCIAYVLCEIFLAEVSGKSLSRRQVSVAVPRMGEGEVPRLTFGET